MSELKNEPFWIQEMFKKGKEYKPNELCNKTNYNVYPTSSISNLSEIPNNVKNDWLYAAEQVVDIIIDYYTDPYKHCRNFYIDKWLTDRDYSRIQRYVNNELSYAIKMQRVLQDLQ